jgi:hypothetical protein
MNTIQVIWCVGHNPKLYVSQITLGDLKLQDTQIGYGSFLICFDAHFLFTYCHVCVFGLGFLCIASESFF